MYGLKLRRLEKDKIRWYHDHGQVPPSLTYRQGSKKKKEPKFDLETYTDTTVLDFDPTTIGYTDFPQSYWDLPEQRRDGGMEPEDYTVSYHAMRDSKVIPPQKLPFPKVHKAKECYTPYQNDVASFEALESTLKELKRQQQQLALEMERVDQEWNREPLQNWFTLKGKTFSRELHRHIELERRNASVTKYERRHGTSRSLTLSPRRQFSYTN